MADKKATDKEQVFQIKDFGSSQFLQWRIITLRSIKKILLNIDTFIDDDLLRDFPKEDRVDLRYNQIRNGFMYEAVAQSIQGIEELFALIYNSKNLNDFTKNHIKYKASIISGYIKKKDWDTEDFVLGEFRLPKLSKEECNADVFELYRNKVELLMENVRDIRSFYIRYARVYNQYKHGLKVGMRPYGHGEVSAEAIEEIRKKPLCSMLHVFANGFGNIQQLESAPAIAISLHPETGLIQNELQILKELQKNKAMLVTELEHFDVQNAIDIATRAAELTSMVWTNIGYRVDGNAEGNSRKYAFPTTERFRQMIITVVRQDKATC